MIHLFKSQPFLPITDDDGFISFEEFITSYARPKPILKNILIMAINTAVIFFILQAPMLDTMMKVRIKRSGFAVTYMSCNYQNGCFIDSHQRFCSNCASGYRAQRSVTTLSFIHWIMPHRVGHKNAVA